MPNNMSVENFVATAKILPADISILLRGETGIGKSQITHALGSHFGLKVIDRRLSQMTDGDMIGLPSTDGEVTRFNPPDWYKDCCTNPRLLFLDELNRATTEVMQAAFQVVLDRELNGWKLHPETRVYCAVNIGSKFTVNEMDPALLRRFWVVDLTPTMADWQRWARAEGKIDETFCDFIAANEKWLDPAKDAEPNSVQTTRHSWERFNNSARAAGLIEQPENPLFYTMAMGFLGTEAAIALVDFCKNQDFRVTGEDIVERYKSVEKKVRSKRMTVDRLNACIDRAVEYVHKNLKTLDDNQGKNIAAFVKDLPNELRVVMWTKLVQAGVENLEMAKAVHKHLHCLILEVFGVPAGEKGVNVPAKIPASMQTK